MQEQSQKKLNIARVPIKRIVTSSEPNRQNSGSGPTSVSNGEQSARTAHAATPHVKRLGPSQIE